MFKNKKADAMEMETLVRLGAVVLFLLLIAIPIYSYGRQNWWGKGVTALECVETEYFCNGESLVFDPNQGAGGLLIIPASLTDEVCTKDVVGPPRGTQLTSWLPDAATCDYCPDFDCVVICKNDYRPHSNRDTTYYCLMEED